MIVWLRRKPSKVSLNWAVPCHGVETWLKWTFILFVFTSWYFFYSFCNLLASSSLLAFICFVWTHHRRPYYFFTECFYRTSFVCFVCTYLYKIYIEVSKSKMPEVHNSYQTKKKSLLPISFPLRSVILFYTFFFEKEKCSAFFVCVRAGVCVCVVCCDEFKCLL